MARIEVRAGCSTNLGATVLRYSFVSLIPVVEPSGTITGSKVSGKRFSETGAAKQLSRAGNGVAVGSSGVGETLG